MTQSPPMRHRRFFSQVLGRSTLSSVSPYFQPHPELLRKRRISTREQKLTLMKNVHILSGIIKDRELTGGVTVMDAGQNSAPLFHGVPTSSFLLQMPSITDVEMNEMRSCAKRTTKWIKGGCFQPFPASMAASTSNPNSPCRERRRWGLPFLQGCCVHSITLGTPTSKK